jgi:hypothetical protein
MVRNCAWTIAVLVRSSKRVPLLLRAKIALPRRAASTTARRRVTRRIRHRASMAIAVRNAASTAIALLRRAASTAPPARFKGVAVKLVRKEPRAADRASVTTAARVLKARNRKCTSVDRADSLTDAQSMNA